MRIFAAARCFAGESPIPGIGSRKKILYYEAHGIKRRSSLLDTQRVDDVRQDVHEVRE